MYAQVINNFKDEVAPKVFSNSPSANSLGNFGQIPVNMFTGQPQINLDLYNIKESNYAMPISLNYSLASVKPDEHPGWTGLGWNLNVGGAITRIIRGGVDEVMVPNIENEYAYSYYNNYSLLGDSDWDSDEKMHLYMTGMSGLLNQMAVPSPDEFVFNVNGLSGSFFLDHNGNWIVKANQNIDIKINESIAMDYKFYEEAYVPNSTSTYYKDFTIKRIFDGFDLITADGTKYVFGKSPYSIEFSSSPKTLGDTYNSNFIAKTWYLTKVILPNQQEINFEYKSDATLPSNPIDGAVYYKAVYKTHKSTIYLKYITNSANYENSSSSRSLERMYNVYLNKITTTNSIINFYKSISNDLDYNTSHSELDWNVFQNDSYTGDMTHYKNNYNSRKHWYKLDKIEVKNIPDNQIVYKVVFNYLEDPLNRLFLNGIVEGDDMDGIDEEGNPVVETAKRHNFSYNETLLPEYNSSKVDHWGYFNNSTYSGNFTETALLNNYSNSKNPNPNYMIAGVLTSIQYPTGGYTFLNYEPHTYSKTISKTANGGITVINAPTTNELAGGLRISSIISNSGDDSLLTQYFYQQDYLNNNTSSSGVLSGIPEYFESYGVSGSVPYLLKLIDNPSVFMNNSSGSHVTYTKVVEKQSKLGSNEYNGFTEYTYSNQDNGYIDLNPSKTFNHLYSSSTPYFYFSSLVNRAQSYNAMEEERGKLLFEKKYNNQNDIVEQNIFYYNSDPTRLNNEIRSLDFTESKYGEMINTGAIGTYYSIELRIRLLTAYKTYSHQTFLEKQENIIYNLSNNTSTLTEKFYTYSNQNGFHQLKQEKQKNSFNEQLITNYYYCKDPEMSSQPMINELISSNMVGVPLNIITFKENTKLFEKLTQYGKSDNTGNLLLPIQIFAKKGDESTIPLERIISYDLYDSKGNIKQYTIENAIPVSIVWGYNQTQPIAKIEGIEYNNLPTAVINAAITASNNGSETDLINALNAIRTNSQLSNYLITTYTYKPVIGISTITDPKGDIQYYTYDSFNRLRFVKDKFNNILSENFYHYKSHPY